MASKAGAIRAGRAFVEFFGDDTQLQRTMMGVRNRLSGFSRSVGAMGRDLLRTSAMILAPLVATGKLFATMGDQVEKMSRRTGIAVESLSQLTFAASQSGTSIDDLEKSVRRMQRTVYDADRGLSTATDALNDLGLSTDDLRNKSPEEQFLLIADRLSKVADMSKRAAIAQQIFGRSGTAMLPMLEDGAAGIEALMRKAEELGLVISTRDAKAAAEFTDEMDIMQRVLKMTAFTVGSELLPVLREAVNWISENGKGVARWVRENGPLLRQLLTWAGRMAVVAGGMLVLAKVAGMAAWAIGTAVTAGKALGVTFTFLAAHPVIAALAAIAAVTVAVGVAMARTRDNTKALLEEARSLRRETEQSVASDRQALERLNELADQEERTNEEKREAIRLLSQLEGRYGILNVRINSTTGAIEGLASETERLNELIRENEISGYERNLFALEQRIESLTADQKKLLQGGIISEEAFNAGKELPLLERQADALRRLIDKIKQVPSSKTPALGGDGPGPEELAEVAAWERRIAALSLQQIDDEEERRRAEIDQRYAYEIEKAGTAADVIAAIKRAKAQEIANLEHELDRRRAEELEREQERIADANKSRAETIEELELRSRYKGIELERALLNLQEKRAIERAKAAGEDLALVEREFELRRAELEASMVAQSAMRSAGTMSSRVEQVLGGQLRTINRDDQTDRAIQKTIKELEEHQKNNSDKIVVFVQEILNSLREGGAVFG